MRSPVVVLLALLCVVQQARANIIFETDDTFEVFNQRITNDGTTAVNGPITWAFPGTSFGNWGWDTVTLGSGSDPASFIISPDFATLTIFPTGGLQPGGTINFDVTIDMQLGDGTMASVLGSGQDLPGTALSGPISGIYTPADLGPVLQQSFVVIPEPGSMILTGLAATCFCRILYRRHRRKEVKA